MLKNKNETLTSNSSPERNNRDEPTLKRIRKGLARWGLFGNIEKNVPKRIGETVNQQHYVKNAPRFGELIGQPRSGMVQYVRSGEAKLAYNLQESDEIVEISEQEAIEQLNLFFLDYQATVADSDSEESQELAKTAENILENMTFIGKEEIQEGAAALADYWKTYLDEDDEAQIIVWSQEHKSSRYIRDAILQQFDGDERYLDRIVDIENIYLRQKDEMPKKYKVIMVDDGISTGRQMSIAYGQDIMRGHQPDVVADIEANTEINLIAAQEGHLKEGFFAKDGAWRETPIPVRSCYKIEQSETLVNNGAHALGSLTTHSHSSTDDGFELPAERMVKDLRENYGKNVSMPPLTNIVRPYRLAR